MNLGAQATTVMRCSDSARISSFELVVSRNTIRAPTAQGSNRFASCPSGWNKRQPAEDAVVLLDGHDLAGRIPRGQQIVVSQYDALGSAVVPAV